MRNTSGFTMIELIVVIAILAIMASFAVPSLYSWRSEAKLKSAVSLIRGDLEMAKSRAMRENNFVAILYNETSYLIFIDDGTGGGDPGDYVRHNDERLLRNRQLPAGVTIELAATTFADNRTRFNGRGYIGNQGLLTIVNSSGAQKQVVANNRFGRITVN